MDDTADFMEWNILCKMREGLQGWRTKAGWTRWEDLEAEAEKDALPVMGS